MSASTWIRRWISRYSSSRVPLIRPRKPKPKPSIRPRLEFLEDRLAPAVLTVNTLVDGTTTTTHLDLREALTLVNNGGNPNSLNQASMPPGWVSQISGTFGDNDTIQFDPVLPTQNGGFGCGVIGLTSVGDGTAGPSALGVFRNVSIVGPSTGPGITIERPATAPGINVPNMRLFYVGAAGDLTLDNLTLQGGAALGGNGGGDGGGGLGAGGAVFNQGTLNIQNSLLTGNSARGGAGYTASGGGGGGMGGNGGPESNGAYGGGPNAGNPNGGPGYTHGSYVGRNGGFGGGGSSPLAKNGSRGANGGFGGGGGGNGTAGDDRYTGYGGNGGFGGGGGGGRTDVRGGGGAGYSEFGGGEGATGYIPTTPKSYGSGGGGAGFGGAIFNDQGTITLTDTTLTGNLAAAGPSPVHDGIGAGAGIFNYNGQVTANYCTLVGNYAAQGGAEIYNLGDGVGNQASLILYNNILADSQGSSEDLHVGTINSGTTFVYGANNLVMSESGPLADALIISTAAPKLGPLQYNGGPTLTMAPLPGSPVLDQGANSGPLGVTTDARGLPRIYDFSSIPNAPFGDGSDLGAVEATPATITVNTLSDTLTDPNSLSLRLAVELADGVFNRTSLSAAQQNLVPGDFTFGPTIRFASSLAGQTIHLASVGDSSFGPSALLINSNLAIVGPTGNHGVTIAGPGANGNLRLFRVTPGASLILENLTLEGGDAVGNAGGNSADAGGGGGGSAGLGGAILNQGNLTLVNSTLTGDTAQGGAGGQSNASFSARGGAGGGGLQSSGSTNNGYYDGTHGGAPAGGYGGPSRFTPNGTVGGYGGGGGGGYGIYGTSGGQGGGGGLFGGGGGGGAGTTGGGGGSGGFGGGGGGGGNGFAGYYSRGGGGAGGYFGGRGGSDALGGEGYGGGGGGGGAGLGGAIFNDLGNVTVVNSTLYGDKTLGGAGGGGFYAGTAGQSAGGAVFNYQGMVSLTNSTLAGNTAQRGGAIFSYQSPLLIVPAVTLNNSILANSVGNVTDYGTNAPGDAYGSAGGNNLITHNSGFYGGIVSSANPKLGPLQNNGGPTQTLALQPGSPAINTGNDAFLSTIAAAEGVPAANATDQTGNVRLFGTHIDIGAVEYHPVAISLAFLKQPVSTTAGQTLTPVQVEVKDQFGNLLPSDNSDKVTLSGVPFASGTTTATVVNGVATFSNLVIDKASTYKLTATSANLTTATSTAFTVNPAAPATLKFLTEPSNETAGKAITPAVKVELVDKFGNVATNSSAAVTMALATNPTGATLGGTTTVNAVNGVATFSSLTLTKAGTGYTLKATEGALSSTSTAFNVTAAAPAGVDIHGQPSDTVVGQAISPAVWVAVVDAYGNTIPTNNTQLVTLSIATGPQGASLGGTTTVRAHDGIATFGNLTLNLAGTYTLEATGGKLTPDFSNTFTVTPVDISDDVSIQQGKLHPAGHGQPHVYEQTLTLTNISSGSLTGPLALVLSGLPSDVIWDNATGTYQDNPYVDALPLNVSLRSGESLTVTLQFFFVGPGSRNGHDLSYTTGVLEGI